MPDIAKLSTGLRNHVLSFGSLKSGLQGGVVRIFSGTVPTSADAADSGVLLATMSDLGSEWTPETISHGSVTLSGGSSGQVTQVSVDGVNLLATPVPFVSSLFRTANLLAEAINTNSVSPRYLARASDQSVLLYATPGTGSLPNGYIVAITTVGISTGIANFSDGVSSFNGIKFAYAAAGVLSKISSQVVRGIVHAPGGSATYWRVYTEAGDIGATDTKGRWRRAQGIVGITDATLIVPTLSFATDSVEKIETFQVRL